VTDPYFYPINRRISGYLYSNDAKF
jgi:hypothetical protein